MFRIDELMTFEQRVTLIVGHLANAVKAEIFSTLGRQNNIDLEDRLVSLVDNLCAEAVDKILQLVHGTPHLYDITEQNSDTVIVPQTSEGGDGGRDPVSSDHTYILVSEKDDSNHRHVVVSVQSLAHSSDQTTVSCSEKMPDVTNVHISTPEAKVNDHEYAQPHSSLPNTASSEHTDVRIRKHRNGCKKSDAIVQTVHCSRCKMLFPNAERLSHHQKKSHPECSVCGEIFTGTLRLRDHEIKEHRLLPYTCDFCGKRFNHKAHHDLHVRARHTGEKSCHCDICGKGYACVSLMKTHRVTHFDKTFICDICGKCFYHACHLTRHKLVHQKVQPYKCATCGKGCTQASNLRSHEAIHTGERQLCAVCGKSYRCLKNHVISKHPHELPDASTVVVCNDCGKKFANHSQLRVHQRSHTGEKPFPCVICGKSFRLKEMLRDHQFTHTSQKPYTCTLCTKTFTLATSFMRHRSIHSGEMPHSCRICGKQFRLLTFLKAHMQTKAHLRRAQQKSSGLEQNADMTVSDKHQCDM